MSNYPELNEYQQKAVNWGNGPLIVFADTKASKRSLVSYRIERFYRESRDGFPFIMGLTHSNKSTSEIQWKIRQINQSTQVNGVANTFDGLASDVLMTHGSHIDVDQYHYVITDTSDKLSFLDEILAMTIPECECFTSQRLLPLIIRLHENDISPDDALPFLKKQFYSEPETLMKIYQKYREQMLEQDVLDTSGLISALYMLFEVCPVVFESEKSIKKYLCIEDFQQLTGIEYRLVKQLVHSDTKNLFVVADIAQMFNEWDTERIDRLREMQQEYGMEICHLPTNHHCPTEIAGLGNRLINQNFKVPNNGIFDHDPYESTKNVSFQQFNDLASEIQWIASDIAKRGPSFRKKCAIVSNSRSVLDRIAETLDEHGVKRYLPFGQQAFESVPMIWFIAMLRFADSRSNIEHLRQACRSFYRLTGITLNIRDITTFAAVEDVDYLRSWSTAVQTHKNAKQKALRMIAESVLPHLVDGLSYEGFQKSAFEWLDKWGKSNSNMQSFTADFASERKIWENFVDETADKYKEQKVTLHLLLEELDKLTASPARPKTAVPCLPIHLTNGMEFEHVYLVGMVDGNIPNAVSIKHGDTSLAMQDERRICASAITKAKKSLTITCSDNMDGILTFPSRFIYEMGLLEVESENRFKQFLGMGV